LVGSGFDSRSPLKNYVRLNERIEELEGKLNRMEQQLIDAVVRLNGV